MGLLALAEGEPQKLGLARGGAIPTRRARGRGRSCSKDWRVAGREAIDKAIRMPRIGAAFA